jgi:L-asparaginase
MMFNPDMVAGPGRFDTRLMEVGRGRLVSKGGAEGYQAIGLLPGAMEPGSPALGITIKISDGDYARRALAAVALDLLRQLGVLAPADLAMLADFGPTLTIHNLRKLVVGEGHPTLKLERDGS